MNNPALFEKILATLQAPQKEGEPDYESLYEILKELPRVDRVVSKAGESLDVFGYDFTLSVTHEIPDPCEYVYAMEVIALGSGDEAETEITEHEMAQYLYTIAGGDDYVIPEESRLEKRIMTLEKKIDLLNDKVEGLIWKLGNQ